MILVVAIFIALLFVNVYFRIKVLKYYKKLVQNKVEFDAKWIFDANKMETEVIVHHPEMSNEIRGFAQNIRNSVKIAAILVVLITIIGCILRYNS